MKLKHRKAAQYRGAKRSAAEAAARLREVLQKGDPYAEGALAPHEIEQMRSRVLEASAALPVLNRPAARFHWLLKPFPAFATLGLLVIAIASILWNSRVLPPSSQVMNATDVGTSPSTRANTAHSAVPGDGLPVVQAAESRLRQLQFLTRGGTRIIWVFNPKFALDIHKSHQEIRQ